jgi:hypothetical protein
MQDVDFGAKLGQSGVSGLVGSALYIMLDTNFGELAFHALG